MFFLSDQRSLLSGKDFVLCFFRALGDAGFYTETGIRLELPFVGIVP